MYGIEFFKYKIGAHELSRTKVFDGKIRDKEPLFKTNKKGYGTFIVESKLDKTGQIKWNKSISDKCMKLKNFVAYNFVDACLYLLYSICND